MQRGNVYPFSIQMWLCVFIFQGTSTRCVSDHGGFQHRVPQCLILLKSSTVARQSPYFSKGFPHSTVKTFGLCLRQMLQLGSHNVLSCESRFRTVESEISTSHMLSILVMTCFRDQILRSRCHLSSTDQLVRLQCSSCRSLATCRMDDGTKTLTKTPRWRIPPSTILSPCFLPMIEVGVCASGELHTIWRPRRQL